MLKSYAGLHTVSLGSDDFALAAKAAKDGIASTFEDPNTDVEKLSPENGLGFA